MKQILIVEDDSFLNKMLAYNLTADGYGVTSALNARTAADAICQLEFDLVLLDINLPDGNGFELCKLIKPRYPDTIVIFLTANDQESDQIRGYFRAGGYDVVVKDALLAEALKALTERKRDVILLSYFMEMNDADIARKLNLVRSTVHEHRTRSLEILKAMLEENVNENGRKKCK